jgi:hypothetical protein
VQRDEPVRGGGIDDRLPPHAGPDAGAARHRVDLDVVHLRGADQQRVLERPLRAREVGATPERHPQAGVRRSAHEIADVLRAARVGDGRRALQDGGVEGPGRLGVALVARPHDAAGGEGAKVGAGSGLRGHGCLLKGRWFSGGTVPDAPCRGLAESLSRYACEIITCLICV